MATGGLRVRRSPLAAISMGRTTKDESEHTTITDGRPRAGTGGLHDSKARASFFLKARTRQENLPATDRESVLCPF